MSDMYAIKTSTLTALGDAVRNKADYNAETQYGRMTVNPPVGIQTPSISVAPNHRFVIDVIDYNFEGYTPFYVYKNNNNGERVLLEDARKLSFPLTYELDCPTIYINIGGNIASFMECTITITPLDEDGNEYKYTPLEMVEELNALPAMPSKLDLMLTGNCSYRFAYGGWDWIIEKYHNMITTKDITSASHMFDAIDCEVPFDINMKLDNKCSMDYMFYNCNGTALPVIHNAKPSNLSNLCYGANNLVFIPEDFCDDWDWSAIDNATGAYDGYMSQMFGSCFQLRRLPMKMFAHGNPQVSASYTIFRGLASGCYLLDEIIDLPNPHYKGVYTKSGSSGVLYNMIPNCYRLKNFTFAPMDPPEWANSTLDISMNTGWGIATMRPDITKAGLTDKEVIDDATYQALKNDPDWWTIDVAYSRYNHDSAVRTINSLPDTTATGSNTIKFKGSAGSKTDGGAINTLTDEEIAVAAAKGWTVAFA